MLSIIYNIIKDYGTFGAVISSTGINIYLFYKLFTNHLKHLADNISNVNNKITDIQKEISPLKERVSKIEGMLE